MSKSFKAACIQMTSGPAIEANVTAASELVRRARDQGAELIMTPEVSDMIEPKRALAADKARPEDQHAMVAAFRDLARETGAWLLLGSAVIRDKNAERLSNRSFLVSPQGEIAARYDKIHMFDVDLPTGERHRESQTYKPGDKAVVAELPWGRLGMTICYDLRFPHLYRALAKAGADFLAVPSAFTVPTGRAHWHVLLRARAIENGCFVFAPAQWGEHGGGRRTFGHALVVAPWGEILAEAEDSTGVIVAEIDPAKVAEARHAVPSLTHDRLFAAPKRPSATAAAD
ncbi:MAG: carbon-nitrogen hydrolase family protein [Alphaproteobacteria bacterium]|nr:carbon-nitrogen hydrolase family protein [Alphaproteobacteria bacterium]MDE1967441.1 carbon-nitrogen hydrolase family protein [Alphaproteobacteria bacterium]